MSTSSQEIVILTEMTSNIIECNRIRGKRRHSSVSYIQDFGQSSEITKNQCYNAQEIRRSSWALIYPGNRSIRSGLYTSEEGLVAKDKNKNISGSGFFRKVTETYSFMKLKYLLMVRGINEKIHKENCVREDRRRKKNAVTRKYQMFSENTKQKMRTWHR